ncbi:MAG: GIY-YIG nuclease family protein [Desulfuromonadaceae bacterium]|nr:GIY-YIG nuclease family protein [Desulfuromonadaceae bacterium]
MPVYFVLDTNTSQVKIGRGSDVRKRVCNLQTGNPSRLLLMGWIRVENDNEVERRLHARYQDHRGIGEWFHIGPTEVLEELQRESGFVPPPKDAFEVVGYDRDGIPEYMGVWEWADFEFYDCCPF